MLRTLRKYNKWIMVVFGTFLMAAFLIPQTIQQLGSHGAGTIVGKIDGEGVRLDRFSLASRQISALDRLVPALTRNALGISDRNVHHWLLLVHEARKAGMIGGIEDGRELLDRLALEVARQSLIQDQETRQKISQAGGDVEAALNAELEARLTRARDQIILPTMAEQGLRTEQEVLQALAEVQGVVRLVQSYSTVTRFSDRRAAVAARRLGDAAVIDAVVIPASRLAVSAAEPTEAEVIAHFERFKSMRPGEGDLGVGYLLPQRVKFEYLTVSRQAIESAVTLDPVEVMKRHRTNRDRYRGEFAVDRPLVEADMRRELVERALQDAQLAIQAEVLKVTRRLDADGRFKRLPADWEAQRPRWEAIAPVVVQAVRRSLGSDIPLPTVTVVADRWVTQAELERMPGLGRSELRQGTVIEPIFQTLFSARELGGGAGSIVPVQVGLPLADTFFQDAAGNRYYVTLLSVRTESAPDSIDEIRPTLVADLKRVRAYDALVARSEELRSAAATGGLDAIVALFPARGGPETSALPRPNAAPEERALDIRRNLRVEREPRFAMDPLVMNEPVRNAALELASRFDPLAPPERIAPADAVKVVPMPREQSLAVIRLQRPSPITIEDFRMQEGMLLSTARGDELPPDAENPFSFRALLRRHNYEHNEVRMMEPEAAPTQPPTTGGA